MIKDEFTFSFFFSAKNKMSFIYQKLRDRERTYIKEKVKSRDKYTCSEFPNDPVEKTDKGGVGGGVWRGVAKYTDDMLIWTVPNFLSGHVLVLADLNFLW